MNSYRKILFQHLDGIVLLPTIVALNKIGLLQIIKTNKRFTIEELTSVKKIFPGYLNISLRILRCSNLLDFIDKQDEFKNIYFTNHNFDKILNNIEEIDKIDSILPYHANFITLNKKEQIKFIRILKDLDLLLSKKDTAFASNFYNNLEGIIIGPIIANLAFYGKMKLNKKKLNFVDLDSKFYEILINLFIKVNFLTKSNKVTKKGSYFFKRASSYGVTVSYLNTLINIPELLISNPNYIWERNAQNHEIHVNRSMNVWGSGGSHNTYFKKIDTIVFDIFNQDIEKQPIGIIDIGCGDGSFLKHAYTIIVNNTKRKDYIETHPIILIGTDINKKAQESTKRNLKGIKSIVIDGDISNPSQIDTILNTKYNLRLEDFVNCRTFLDHNRIYNQPTKKLDHNIYSQGSFSFKGQIVSSKDLIDNLIIHLREWKKFISKHGLIIVELHTLDPEITRKNSGNSLACAYDGTHGFSDQYLVEYDIFRKCIEKAGGVISDKNESLFPKNIPTVSINYIR
jgi:hypothetical protein